MGFMEDFIKKNRITEVECLVPDMSGIARGKIVPAEKFLRILRDRGLRLPEAIFVQTVTGEFPDDEDITSDENSDIYMIPDERTIRFVPWYNEPTAQVITDCVYADGRPVDVSPRHVLKRILALYEERGWKPMVAPELEFFLVQVNKDPDYPLV
ncbi:MAG: glutamine synthetase, partial [Alphaproteobacteria bacterium]